MQGKGNQRGHSQDGYTGDPQGNRAEKIVRVLLSLEYLLGSKESPDLSDRTNEDECVTANRRS